MFGIRGGIGALGMGGGNGGIGSAGIRIIGILSGIPIDGISGGIGAFGSGGGNGGRGSPGIAMGGNLHSVTEQLPRSCCQWQHPLESARSNPAATGRMQQHLSE